MPQFDPSMLARLALGTGQAQYHQTAVNRDLNFVNSELDRRAAFNTERMNNEYEQQNQIEARAAEQQQQQEAFQLQQAAQRRRMALDPAYRASQTSIGTPTKAGSQKSSVASSIAAMLPSQKAKSENAGGTVGRYSVDPQGNVTLSPGASPDIDPRLNFGAPIENDSQITPGVPMRVGPGGVIRRAAPLPGEPLQGLGVQPGASTGVPADPHVQAQLDYLAKFQGKMPPEQYEALKIAAQSGELKLDQLIDDTKGAMPAAPRATAPKTQGLNLRDRQLNLQSLRTQRAGLIARGFVEGDAELAEFDALIAQQEAEIKTMQQATFAPQLGVSLAQPNPTPGGKPMTREVAGQFLQQAGGDKERARQMAREQGYTF